MRKADLSDDDNEYCACQADNLMKVLTVSCTFVLNIDNHANTQLHFHMYRAYTDSMLTV